MTMSLLRLVKPSHLQLLVSRSFGSAPSLVSRRRSSSLAEDKEDAVGSTKEGHSLKSVDDLPVPNMNWQTLRNTSLPTPDFHEWTLETNQSIGKLFRLPIPFVEQRFVMTSSPQHASEMFRNEGVHPFRPGGNHLADFMAKIGYTTGLVNTNWDEWHSLRMKANKQIVPRKIVQFAPQIYDMSGDVVDCIRAKREKDNTVKDVLPILMDWSVEGVGIFILGQRLNLFTTPTPRMKEFQMAGISFAIRMVPMMNFIPWHKLFPTPTSVKFKNAVFRLEAIAKELAEERMAELKKKIDSGEEVEGICFLDQWLLDEKISMQEMFSLMRDFLSAGTDTSSVTATWILYEMARRPEVQKKLREEIQSVMGSSDVPTSNHLQELHYAKNILTETLRLHPVASAHVRALDSSIVLDGYKIPKGTWMLCDNYSMSRDPSVFEDPLLFNPDRWTREYKKEKAFANIPFGFGPRSCYGRRLAELELVLFIVQIARNFELRTDQAGLKMRGVTVLAPSEPVCIQFNDLY